MDDTLLPSYRRLADFFSTKGDAPLSSAEVTVCLEWLREATVKSAPVFATPAPSLRSIRKQATKTVDLTPVKRQIRELLASREESSEMRVDGKAADGIVTRPKPVAMTRTAKTILDVLDNPTSRAPEGGEPPLAPAIPPTRTTKSFAIPIESSSEESMGTLEESPSLPSFKFQWDEDMDVDTSASAKQKESVSTWELPKFSFD